MTDRLVTAENQLSTRETTFLIEVGDKDVGLAVVERGGFSFIASDPRSMPLDGRRFADLSQLRRAVAEKLKDQPAKAVAA
jgi:hypothetical protein